MVREEYACIYEENTSIKKVLKDHQVSEWTDIFESRGVLTLSDLRKVKYTELVQYGITEFESRKKIFELIKRINSEHPREAAAPKTPLQNRVRELTRSSIGFSFIDKDSFAARLKEPATPKGTARVSVFKDGYTPPSNWKRKKEMVSEIMEEAENSIVEDSQLDFEEASQLSNAADPGVFSDSWPQSVLAGSESFIGGGEARPVPVPNTPADSAAPMAPHMPTPRLIPENHQNHAENGRITVVVRKRPLRKARANVTERDAIAANGPLVVLMEHKQKIDLTPYVENHQFLFDRAFGEHHTTDDLYRESVKSLVDHALHGGSSTCLAYGQTGSGKTYTMLDERSGIIAQAIKDLLQRPVQISFYEIYGNYIYDLLCERKRVFAREKDGIVSVVGLSEKSVSGAAEAMALIRTGLASRMTGRTGANMNSSRSHALFRVKTSQGLFTFVDLAGSERGSERATEDGQEMLLKREGAEINKSLLALKECIRAMDRSASHLPFRHSKLTQVLKESLVGNSKCCIIATVSPEESSVEHTLNTLRYAFRIKEIGTRANPKEPSQDTPSPRARVLGPPASVSVENSPRSGASASASATNKALVQQALASVAARIARESDPATLKMLKDSLLNLAGISARKPQ
ncbi:kinesin family member 2/24 [Nematocida displodere]|uniref:Kinesin family member 2/24 n=1 Tax=Nematocida displodere TaxID=1805483 RepID=A0A177EIJ2_9MICR|nr:kinesin family member 2/24 [Nematocida displodere]